MSVRVTLRSPFGPVVTRDIVAGLWADPAGDADRLIGEHSWAVPGLVDAHAHLSADELFAPGDLDGAMARARQALGSGVTLLLDKGWADDTAIQAMDGVPPDERPDIEAAAQLIAAVGGYYPGFAREIEGHDIAETVIAAAQTGRGWVKLSGDWPRKGVGPVANFTEDELRTAVDAAGRHGARVAIHTMAPDVPSMAVSAGVHSIEHGLFLTEGDLETLAARAGMWVPTILRIEATLAQLGESSSGGKLMVDGLSRVRALLPVAVEAGVHVLAGTDLVGSPANVGAEIVKLADYGLSEAQALAAGSVAGFHATARDAVFSPGTPANAVLFPANPLEDLDVLTHPEVVIRMGSLR